MNNVSFHKRDLQLVIQCLSIARIIGLSEELRLFSANPIKSRNIHEWIKVKHAVPVSRRAVVSRGQGK